MPYKIKKFICSFVFLFLILFCEYVFSQKINFLEKEQIKSLLNNELAADKKDDILEITELIYEYEQLMSKRYNNSFATEQKKQSALGNISNACSKELKGYLGKIESQQIMALLTKYRNGNYSALDKAKLKEMNNEIKSFYLNDVLPVIAQERSKLEAKLSSAQKDTISFKRKQLNFIKKRISTKMSECENLSNRIQKRNCQKELKKLRGGFTYLINDLKNNINKEYPLVETHLANLEPQKKQWIAQINEMMKKYYADEPVNPEFSAEKQLSNLKPLDFLLLNSENAGKQTSVLLRNLAYNQIDQKVHFTYRKIIQSSADIVLYDKNGTIIHSLSIDPEKNIGFHNHFFDCASCPTGLYFISIQDEGKSNTQKLFISK